MGDLHPLGQMNGEESGLGRRHGQVVVTIGFPNDVLRTDGVQARGVKTQIWKSPSGTSNIVTASERNVWLPAVYSRVLLFHPCKNLTVRQTRLAFSTASPAMHRGQRPAYLDPPTILGRFGLSSRQRHGVGYMRGGCYSVSHLQFSELSWV